MFYALLLVVIVVIFNCPTSQLIVQRSMRDLDSKRSPGSFFLYFLVGNGEA